MLYAVCGFYFSTNRERVILINKKRPDWQAGHWNGVGGKIEGNESRLQAMRREFEEETGVYVEGWEEFCDHRDLKNLFQVTYFRSFGDDVRQCRTKTDEEVLDFPIGAVFTLPVVHNLVWLIPMALDPTLRSAKTIWRDP